MTSILAAGDHFVTSVAITDALARTVPDVPVTSLQLPWPVVPFGAVGNVHEASGTEEEVSDALQGHEVFVTQMAPVTAKILDENPQLRLIGVCRGGPVNVDVNAAAERGVTVSFAPGRNAAATAELALGLAFAALRDIPQSADALRRGVWEGERYYALENTGRELDESTVGVTALLLRECREIMGGDRSRLMRSIGGGAKSSDWLQIKADVLGAPVMVPTHGHGAAVGAALLAALEQGAVDEQFIRERGRSARAAYEPDLGRHARYTDRLAELQQLRSAVRDIRDQGSAAAEQPSINREKTSA